MGRRRTWGGERVRTTPGTRRSQAALGFIKILPRYRYWLQCTVVAAALEVARHKIRTEVPAVQILRVLPHLQQGAVHAVQM